MIIDGERKIYGEWGLGLTSLRHFFDWTVLTEVLNLAWNQNIRNRSTHGTRWQQGGIFAARANLVCFAKAAEAAYDTPDLNDAAKTALGTDDSLDPIYVTIQAAQGVDFCP